METLQYVYNVVLDFIFQIKYASLVHQIVKHAILSDAFNVSLIFILILFYHAVHHALYHVQLVQTQIHQNVQVVLLDMFTIQSLNYVNKKPAVRMDVKYALWDI